MWEELLAQAERILAPSAKITAGEDVGQGEVRLAVDGTSVRVKIPSWMHGKLVEVSARGANVDFLFGGAAVDVVYNEPTGVATETMTVDVNTGRGVQAGTTRTIVCPYPEQVDGLTKDSTLYMSIEASAAGFFEMSVRSQRIFTRPG